MALSNHVVPMKIALLMSAEVNLLLAQFIPAAHILAYGAVLVWVFMEVVDAAAELLSGYDDIN